MRILIPVFWVEGCRCVALRPLFGAELVSPWAPATLRGTLSLYFPRINWWGAEEWRLYDLVTASYEANAGETFVCRYVAGKGAK